jgi:hypothetical protein
VGSGTLRAGIPIRDASSKNSALKTLEKPSKFACQAPDTRNHHKRKHIRLAYRVCATWYSEHKGEKKINRRISRRIPVTAME